LEAVFLGLKLLEFEAVYSPTASARVKNAWSYTSILPYNYMGVVLKHRSNFTYFS
jgi:hypothetical protein